MATQQAEALVVDRSRVGTLELGRMTVPYVDLEDEPFVSSHLRVGDAEYTYSRSFPIKGHGAVMPDVVSELLAAGRSVLVAERRERYYLYLA